MIEKGYNQLIDKLAGNVGAVKPLSSPFKRAAFWFLAMLVYMGVVTQALGIARPLSAFESNAILLFDIALMFVLAFAAALASAFLCIPDIAGRKDCLIIPLTLLAVFIAWSGFQVFGRQNGLHSYPTNCYIDALALGSIPAAMMMYMSRNGASTRPYMSALMNILSVTGLAYIGLRFTCTIDSVSHIYIYHLLPFIIIGAIIGAGARYIYRW